MNLYQAFPQILKNIKFNRHNNPLNNKDIQNFIKEKECLFGEIGRLVIRESGTEPLIRVMGEHKDFSVLQDTIGEIVYVIENFS